MLRLFKLGFSSRGYSVRDSRRAAGEGGAEGVEAEGEGGKSGP